MAKGAPHTDSQTGAMASLVSVLNNFHPLSAGVINYLKDHIFPVSYKKGKLILKAGAVCSHVYFIRKGAIRGFTKEEGKDITTWITAENEMVTSITSFDLQVPALENIQAIENCDLLAMTFDDLQQLYIQLPEFNIVTRKLLERYYRDAEGRAFISRLTKAESKYIHFLRIHSHLSNRIPLKYIASYLGIAEETLSRVRKKISNMAVKRA
jgi:CRP-like cAMP-binding protein